MRYRMTYSRCQESYRDGIFLKEEFDINADGVDITALDARAVVYSNRHVSEMSGARTASGGSLYLKLIRVERIVQPEITYLVSECSL